MILPTTPEQDADRQAPTAAAYRRRFHRGRAMQAILDRERMRADRNGHRLAIAVFEPAPGSSGRRFNARIRAALLGGTRATDDVGWYGRRAAAAIMPYTGTDEGRAMAARIRRGLNDAGVRCVVHLHSYHHNDREHDRDDDDDRHGGGASLDRVVSTARQTPATEQAATAAAREMQVDRETAGAEWRFVATQPAWKRAMDVAGAIGGLIVFAPLMVLVAAAIKLTSPGPVLFRQRRAGLYGRPFTILKFRTMVTGAESLKPVVAHLNEQDGPTFKVRHDPRVTPIGRLLRRTCVDELPQLVNVLLGQMSLVGPRPLDIAEAVRCTHWHRQRLDVLPGMTCIWQVSGRPRHCFDQWARMDIRYARTRSPWLDVKLLARTLPVVLLNHDAPW